MFILLQNSKTYIWIRLFKKTSAVKRLIAINHIQNKRFCLHNICVCVLCIFITHTYSIYFENIYIHIIYIIYKYV